VPPRAVWTLSLGCCSGFLRVRLANGAFYDCYGLKSADVQDRPLDAIPGGQWSADELKAALGRVSSGASISEHLESEQNFPALGKRAVAISARRIETSGDTQIVVAIQDITAHKEAERILFEEQDRLKQTVQVGAEKLKRATLSLETETLGRSHAEAALQETEGALRRSREELRALTASLLNTQEEERRRVSRELHDDLSQKMAKLQFDVETLEQKLPTTDGDLKTRLLSVRDQVGTVANDVRRIAYQLRPSALEHLGLSVALRSVVREFREREGLEVHFEARRVPRNIAPEIATSVYRIVQEALRNVAKHAGRTAVEVILKGQSNEMRLTVRDHGGGFNASAVQGGGGLGLISMQERVRLIGGDFLLNTSPGGGVEIIVRVPLTR
jgi:signal transduction histidine kinase